jgi:hypothetical protein
LPPPNLTEMFSNSGLAPNCMVMLAVVIKMKFQIELCTSCKTCQA